MQLRTVVYGTALAIMLGWLLWIGKPVLLPVIAAIISLYILSAAASALGRLPVLRRSPPWLLRALVLLGFTCVVLLLFALVITSFTRVVEALPGYQSNLDALVARVASAIGFQDQPNWTRIREATLDQIDARSVIAPLALSIRGLSGTLFLIALYSAFLLAERAQFERKLHAAIRDREGAERMMRLLERINERIGRYLLVKTLVNAILGAASYAIMWLIGIEFALFWAVLIGFLNYIPYVGSLLGVLFPVLLCLAQFGSVGVAVLALAALSAAQMYVGAVLEPRMMGRAFNLSPFVVLVSLAIWATLWGIPGAILAVPLTASLVIVLAEIEATRPAALLMSASGRL